ncbi:variable surface protein [Plasmodium gonderi]|uniref:Variable surface protein n=1 Tax=Plasmodium gonderi TaxID=77519 RepID=A0A1Y1JXK5_PLAGO|nr:variable surface protein [Plasmodium gonderi]GAW84534.1 variable surface protein [Plasmodium gonderi]
MFLKNHNFKYFKSCYLVEKIGKNLQLSISFRDDLPSEKFYNTLDELKDITKYKEHCASLTSIKAESAVKNVCAKILKYLSSNENLMNYSNAYDICRLLNYWLANKLSVIVGHQGKNYVWTIFAKITNIWNDFIEDTLKKSYTETCFPLMNEILPEDWKKRKELYEYYVDYDTLKNMFSYKINDKDYCTLIKNKVLLYKYFKNFCNSYETEFCNEFKAKYEACNPNELLQKFKCKNELAEMMLLEEKSERELHQGILSETHILENESRYPGLFTKGKQNLNVIQKISNSFSPLKKSGAAILGVLAISMIYGLLYKVNRRFINLHKRYIFFTPLGSWIRKRFAKNNYNRININSEFNGEFNYAQELYNIHYNPRDEHYIGYHSE